VLAAALTVSDRTIARGMRPLPVPSAEVAAVWGGVPLQQPTRRVPRASTDSRGGASRRCRAARRRPSPSSARREVGGANVDLAAGDDLVAVGQAEQRKASADVHCHA
jgi:hypothetical protein